ncbi:MAG: hypothetical protein ACRDG4_15810, partial [Chloroflexota bacterium]
MPVSEHSRPSDAKPKNNPDTSLLDELAEWIIDQPEPRDLALRVYRRLKEVMSADSFYAAIGSRHAEGLHAVVVMDEDVEYPPASVYIEPYGDNMAQDISFFNREDTRDRWTFGTGRPSASCLTCTMRARGRVVGQVSTMSYRDDAYDAASASLFRAVARLLTVAFDRAIERQEAARREDELIALLESNRLVSASLEATEILRGLATSLAKTLGDGAAIISRLDQDETLLIPGAYAAAPPEEPKPLPAPFTVA